MTSKTFLSLTLALAVIGMAHALPASAQSVLGAASEVESSIQSSMSGSAAGTGPTLGQLGGVQAGSTGGDAGGGQGGGMERPGKTLRYTGKDLSKGDDYSGKKTSPE